MKPGEDKLDIIGWFAANPVAANLLMFCILLGGAFSIVSIKKKIFPDIMIDAVTVQVPYLGAAPKEVEEAICLRVEESIEDVEGIKKLTSEAREGMGITVAEVDDGYDVLEVLDEIKLRVDAISTFPAQTEEPLIFRNRRRDETIKLDISGVEDERQLKELAQRIRDELVALPGISVAEVEGEREYEISIELSETKLQAYGLTFDDVARRVANASIDLPGGRLQAEGGDMLLRVKGQAYNQADFANLVLLTRPDGGTIRLSDVARIVDGFEEVGRWSRFDGKPSLGINVYSVGKQSVLESAERVKEYVAEKSRELPEGVEIHAWGDTSFYLRGRLNMMLKNLGFGALLVFLVLTMFLRLRLAFWVVIGIPVAFLGTLWLMPLQDVTVNMISLFGFILVLGILVDDAIVIGESIYTRTRREGQSLSNVILGAKEVAIPATFGVLTTIMAFVPMLLISGSFGAIWHAIGLVVILCLLFSLVESKLILPAHLAHMPPEAENPRGLARLQQWFSRGLERFIERFYQPLLHKALDARYLTLALFLALLVITIGAIGGGLVRFVFFPNLPSDYCLAKLRMAPGTPKQVTEQYLLKMESSLMDLHRESQDSSGVGLVRHARVTLESDVSGVIIVELMPSEKAVLDSFGVIDLWRERLGTVPGAENLAFSADVNAFEDPPLGFELKGNDFAQLEAASLELENYLRDYNGVFDIRNNLSGGKQELMVDITPEGQVAGLSLADVARQVRQAFYGAEAQRVQRGNDEVKVMVRFPLEDRRSLEELQRMRIRTPVGQMVPFDSVATVRLDSGYVSINRVDRKRAATISANVNKDQVEPAKIVKEIQEGMATDLLKRYPGITFGLSGQSQQEQESLDDLIAGAVLALFGIYALMAIPLRSYVQPLIIMSVIPFGLVGAVVGHLVLGLPLSVLSLCGIIALAGVVVNDSLVMVDFVNREISEGISPLQAARDAGAKRFRAILLTSLTTFVGLIPIITEKSLQAQIVIPMAISLAFGILFATIITLFLIPALYVILQDLHGRKAHLPLPTELE